MRQLEHCDLMWIVRRMPHAVASLLQANPDTFLAGGFIRACIAGEDVKDVDLFTSTKDRAVLLANQLAQTESPPRPIHSSDNALSLSLRHMPVQFIHRWTFKSAEECVQSFDFTIARAAVWHDGEKEWRSVCDDHFYSDLAAKRLVYCHPVRNEDVGGSMLRLLKFYSRGYRAPLRSIGGVVARLAMGVEWNREGITGDEEFVSRIITGKLKEVDPNSIDFERP